jgi:hypothetical protein
MKVVPCCAERLAEPVRPERCAKELDEEENLGT